MRCKIILILLFFVGVYTDIQGQARIKDIVYLKDGGVLKGRVLEYNPEETIKIKIVGGSILVYESSKVLKIEQIEKKKSRRMSAQKEVPNRHKPSDVGWYHAVAGELFFYGNMGICLMASTGWSFHRMLGIGGGIGAMTWRYSGVAWVDGRTTRADFSYTFVPIYANIRGNFMKTSTSLFYDMNVGYSISLQGDIGGKGGLYLRPSIGVRFSSKVRTHTFLDIGCIIQASNYEYAIMNGGQVVGTKIFYSPSIRVGVVF